MYYVVNDILLEEFNSVSDYVLFHTLMKFIRYDSCKLSYDNGIELKLKNIIEESKLTRSTCKRILNKFIDMGIICKIDSIYYGNPYVFCKGNRVYKSTLDMFNDTKYKRFNISKIKE